MQPTSKICKQINLNKENTVQSYYVLAGYWCQIACLLVSDSLHKGSDVPIHKNQLVWIKKGQGSPRVT